MNFSDQIIDWYRLNHRELPWRLTKDPYKIWLSEIILQQTRVAQGMPYYLKFIKNYPTVHELAQASEDHVLNSWKGLGYYSRARNLHQSAKDIVHSYNGEFPGSFDEILKLKGVGEYTAAAIASFAFNEAVPVLDGNVFRLLARYFACEEPIDTGAGKKVFKSLLNEVFNIKKPAEFNQAVMEFGAMVCTPKLPKCEDCVLNGTCASYRDKKQSELPIKAKKIKKRDRYFSFLKIEENDNLAIEKRRENDIWANMYQLPLLETKSSDDDLHELIQLINEKWGLGCELGRVIKSGKHVLTHQNLYYRIITVESMPNSSNFTFLSRAEISNLAFPKLLDKYLPDI